MAHPHAAVHDTPRAAFGVTPLKGALLLARQSRFHRFLTSDISLQHLWLST
jgi:hypothetical protein